eukprot:NODE_4148_length_811_cov_56.350877_g4125_i0.p1 GENE.NODE_4148_length_811_cov_56.350877_g4125_i0~~NODE_4148_length_811_cov_56.350877_g4125_i0.p1  ORF type:complete len:225 (+),score=64.62 NODE_4148_length_811_cov_56.350877_g4125_i0:60-677(+)
MSDYDLIVKVVLIGDSGVGKSSLLLRFSDDMFDSNYIATIGVDFRISTVERANKIVKLQLWDTAGQERFKTITQSYYRGAHAVGVCFDTTDLESFDHIQNWLRDVDNYSQQDVAIILVGTKADLVTKRAVPQSEVQAFADAHKFKYVETSAKNNTAVDSAFMTLVDEVLAQRKEQSIKSNPNTFTLGAAKPMKQKKRGCFDFLFG